MNEEIVIIDGDRRQCQQLCGMLESWHYRAVPTYSLKGFKRQSEKGTCFCVILDIDSIAVDNRIIGDLVRQYPEVLFFCMSHTSFHPELQEAIGSHFYACLSKPVDPEELSFWLSSITENNNPM